VTRRLVPWPRIALAVIAASIAVVAILGALVHDKTHTDRLDSFVLHGVTKVVPGDVQRLFLHLTDPPLVAGLLTSIAVVSLILRRWDLAILAAIAPTVEVLLTEQVLKPLVHRSNVVVTAGLGQTESLAYPSGHETGVASLVTVLGLVVLGSSMRLGRKIAALIGLTLVLMAAAVALVGQFYHFATDTVGSVGVAIAVTLAVALAIDQVSAAVSSRPRAPVREPG
jgi:hypothetical protein